MKYTAVLDLKSACNVVLQSKLMKSIEKRVPEHITESITLILQRMKQRARGDVMERTA